jgi:hypothetical protein
MLTQVIAFEGEAPVGFELERALPVPLPTPVAGAGCSGVSSARQTPSAA